MIRRFSSPDPSETGTGDVRPERPRRLRRTEAIRGLVRETVLTPGHLVLPQFVIDGREREEPIDAIPGRARRSIDLTIQECRAAMDLGVRAFSLFAAIDPAAKTPDAREALRPDNLVCRAVREIKDAVPEACVITDVALDPFSSLGHDGLIGPGGDGRGIVLNDETVAVLAGMAVLHAEAGADVVAPSDMMDGRVGAIRTALESAGHHETVILSYAVKYASALYGPFRSALGSAPVDVPGVPRDKRTYQMDPANAREALREVRLDEAEGADVVMIKPAGPYLDVIRAVREATTLPVAAYQVSGEYAMLRAAAGRGWLDGPAALAETLTSIRRAGADLIFTYGALDFARGPG